MLRLLRQHTHSRPHSFAMSRLEVAAIRPLLALSCCDYPVHSGHCCWLLRRGTQVATSHLQLGYSTGSLYPCGLGYRYTRVWVWVALATPTDPCTHRFTLPVHTHVFLNPSMTRSNHCGNLDIITLRLSRQRRQPTAACSSDPFWDQNPMYIP